LFSSSRSFSSSSFCVSSTAVSILSCSSFWACSASFPVLSSGNGAFQP
jgi:hypothetical protein